MVKKHRVELGFDSILINRTLEEEVCDMTFVAGDGLIISAAHQSLTTTTASPTSFPRALLTVSSAVTRGLPQAIWSDNPESLLLSLLVPGRAHSTWHTFPRHLLAPMGLQVRPPGHWEGHLGTSWSHRAAWQEERGSGMAAEGSHQSSPCPNTCVCDRTRVLAPCTALGNVRTSPPG